MFKNTCKGEEMCSVTVCTLEGLTPLRYPSSLPQVESLLAFSLDHYGGQNSCNPKPESIMVGHLVSSTECLRLQLGSIL